MTDNDIVTIECRMTITCRRKDANALEDGLRDAIDTMEDHISVDEKDFPMAWATTVDIKQRDPSVEDGEEAMLECVEDEAEEMTLNGKGG